MSRLFCKLFKFIIQYTVFINICRNFWAIKTKNSLRATDLHFYIFFWQLCGFPIQVESSHNIKGCKCGHNTSWMWGQTQMCRLRRGGHDACQVWTIANILNILTIYEWSATPRTDCRERCRHWRLWHIWRRLDRCRPRKSVNDDILMQCLNKINSFATIGQN